MRERVSPQGEEEVASTMTNIGQGTIMKRLDNKVAIVTGASKGIGAGIARAFGAEGAAVIVNYARDQTDAERVVREITGKGGRAIAGQRHVAQRSAAQRLVPQAKKAFRRPYVLVNHAGRC